MFNLIVLLIVIIMPAPSFALAKNGVDPFTKNVWQKNGIVINNSSGRSIKQNSRIFTLANGSSVIVWEDGRNGFTDIYAQKISADGKNLWGEDGIPVCVADKNQTFPQIIDPGDGNVIVAWQDYRNEYSDIYAQKLDKNGMAMWDKGGIAVCKATGNQLAPQLCPDSSGGAIITWYDYRSGKGEDIYAQRVTSYGYTFWQTDGVPVCVETSTQWYPQIISDGSGGAVICWDDKRAGYYDIYAQRLDGSGKPLWQVNGTGVCTAPENQEYGQIASCEPGTFVITWQDYRNGNADIYAQKVDLDGKILWKANGIVVCNVATNQEKPQIVGGQNPVIIWTDFRNGSGNSDIYCQKISSAGAILWSQYGMPVCEAPGNQSNPRAAADGEDGAIVVWQDQRSSTDGIFARRINKDGKALWVSDGKTICKSDFSAEFPQISSLDNGNYVIVWQDRRHGGIEVFAQSLNSIGSVLWKENGVDAVVGYGSVTQQKPRIVKSGKDGYVISFEDYRNGYSNIYAQKINNAGKLLWARDAERVCNYDSDQMNPELVSDDDGGTIIVWEDKRAGTSGIYAQRLDAFGNKLWDENGILICQSDGEKTDPQIARDMQGGAIIVWLDTRRSEGKFDVFGQRINKNGGLEWRIDGVDLSTSPGIQTNVRIESDGENGAMITWTEYKGNVNTPDIYAQRLGPSGSLQWGLSCLGVCKAPEAQRNPDIAVNDHIVIVWEDSGGGNYDIYAQKLNKDGTILWPADGTPVCTAPFTQHEPRLILTSDGGAVIAWEDYRKANWDIFAQKLNAVGSQEWGIDGVEVCGVPGTQYSPQIIKSDHMSSIIVWEDYRNNKSYNIYAQKLSTSGELLWEKDGTPICLTESGARNPQIVDDGQNGAIVVWTDYRYGSYDIYAQRINETR